MKLLKLAAALSALVLSGCVVVPLHHYRPHGYYYHGPGWHDGGNYYQHPRRRW